MRFLSNNLLFFSLVLTYCFCATLCQDEASRECQLQKQPKLVQINNENYLMSHLKTYIGTAPTKLRYFDGEIMYKSENNIFSFQKDSIADRMIRYKLFMEKKSKYVDNFGNIVVNKKKISYIYEHHNNKKVKLITDIGTQTDYLSVDMDKNRIYLIGYNVLGLGDCGSLFVFNMAKYDVTGGIIKLQAIQNVYNNIAAISVDTLSGNLAIVVKDSSRKWSLHVLENVNTESCKVPPQQVIYKDALKSAVKLAGEELIKLYEEAITGNFESEIIKRRKYIQFPVGGNTKPSIDNKLASDTTPTPAYSDTAAVDFNNCGYLYMDMTTEIEKLKSDNDILRTNYNNWYDKIFESDALKNLSEFEKIFYNTQFNTTKFENKNVVCYDANNNENIIKSLTEAKDIIKKTINWFIFTKDSIDSDESKKLF